MGLFGINGLFGGQQNYNGYATQSPALGQLATQNYQNSMSQAYAQAYAQNNMMNSSLANQQQMMNQTYYNQITGLHALPQLRKAHEHKLLEDNEGLKELHQAVIEAEEQYKVFLALLMPSDEELLRGTK